MTRAEHRAIGSRLDGIFDASAWRYGEPKILHRLNGAKTNEVYLIELDGERQVLRLEGLNSTLLGINRPLELHIQQLASAAGLAPKVIFSDVERGIMLTEYIDGRGWSHNDILCSNTSHQLTQLVADIQVLPAVESATGPFYWVTQYRQGLQNRGAEDDARLLEVLALFHEEIEPVLRKEGSERQWMGHSDLVAENLIFDLKGNLFALDWEYAGLRHPLFDLATVVENHDLTECASAALLTQFCETSGEYVTHEFEQLHSQRLLVKYLNVLWQAMQGADNHWLLSEAKKLAVMRYS